MKFVWLLPFCGLFVVISVQSGHGKLLLVQSLFRHGDRSPTHLYPNDPNPESVWAEGLGKITQLGRRQHYMLGKQLRSRYSDFITSNPNEVVVNSTSIDRCLRSAECHLAGLYAPSPEWQFIPGFNWQPIPIHYVNKSFDMFLNPKVKCPRAEEEERRVYNSSIFRKFYKENLLMLRNMSECSGEKLTLKNARRLAGTLRIQMEYNLDIPPCVHPYYNQLQKFSDVCHAIIYQSSLIQKFRAGPLLGMVIENMNKKLKGDVPDFKFQVYSARDRNVIAMLEALKVFNNHIPPYAATVLFELHQLDDGPSVRLLLMNSTRPEDGNQVPHLLTLEDCGEYCPLDHFVRSTKALILKNFEKECQMNS